MVVQRGSLARKRPTRNSKGRLRGPQHTDQLEPGWDYHSARQTVWRQVSPPTSHFPTPKSFACISVQSFWRFPPSTWPENDTLPSSKPTSQNSDHPTPRSQSPAAVKAALRCFCLAKTEESLLGCEIRRGFLLVVLAVSQAVLLGRWRCGTHKRCW